MLLARHLWPIQSATPIAFDDLISQSRANKKFFFVTRDKHIHDDTFPIEVLNEKNY